MYSKIRKLIYVSFLLLIVLCTSSISYAIEFGSTPIPYSGTSINNLSNSTSVGPYSIYEIKSALNLVNDGVGSFDNDILPIIRTLKDNGFESVYGQGYYNSTRKYTLMIFPNTFDIGVYDMDPNGMIYFTSKNDSTTDRAYVVNVSTSSSTSYAITIKANSCYNFTQYYLYTSTISYSTADIKLLSTSSSRYSWDSYSYFFNSTFSDGDVNPSNLLTNDDYYSILNYINSSDIVKNSLSSSSNTDFFIVYKFYNETFDDYTFDVYFYDKKTILGQYVSQLTSEDEKFYRIRRREISNFTEFWDNYILGENWQVDFDHFVMSYSTQSKEVTDFYFSSYKNGQTMPLFNYEKEPIVFSTKTIQFYDSVPDISNSIWENHYDSSKNIAGFIVTNPSDPNEVISPDIRPSITDNDLNVGNVFYNTSSFNQYFSTISSLFSSPNAQWIFSSINTLFTTFGSYILMCCVLVFITRII